MGKFVFKYFLNILKTRLINLNYSDMVTAEFINVFFKTKMANYKHKLYRQVQ